MGAKIHSHRPGLKILVTKRKRSTVVTGRGGILSNPQTFDLAPALGDKGSCVVTKNLYAYHGEFHIILPDMPFNFGGQDGIHETVDSPYGLIEPMDIVRIHMDRDVKRDMPIVMRGLVRSVGRDETVGEDGRPMRRVSIVGHDFGAIFTMSQLRLLVSLNEGDVVDPLYPYLKLADLVPGPVPIEDFIGKMLRYANSSLEGATGVTVQPVFEDVAGFIFPTTLPAMEGPLWVTMIRYSDSPWNELFVRDPPTGDSPELVFRPTPWKTVSGGFIKFGGFPGVINAPEIRPVPVVKVEMKDVLSISAHRDDSGVANFIWVDIPASWISANWRQLVVPQAKEIAESIRSDPNSAASIYGNRVLTQTSFIGPDRPPNSLLEGPQEISYLTWDQWRVERIKWLRKASEDNADLERGLIVVKGDPKYQIGNYLNLNRGVPWEAYMVGVTHEYHAYRDYLTTIEFIRGTGFIERVNADNPWYLERKTASNTPPGAKTS